MSELDRLTSERLRYRSLCEKWGERVYMIRDPFNPREMVEDCFGAHRNALEAMEAHGTREFCPMEHRHRKGGAKIVGVVLGTGAIICRVDWYETDDGKWHACDSELFGKEVPKDSPGRFVRPSEQVTLYRRYRLETNTGP